MVRGQDAGARLEPTRTVIQQRRRLINASSCDKLVSMQNFLRGVASMAITVEATYENGTLKLAQPLPLLDHEKVRITIEPKLSWTERTAGMLKWSGDPEILRRLAEDDEFSILESP
jgi:predicted DNA-binding antitoxin AbrB/MazE fold protein